MVSAFSVPKAKRGTPPLYSRRKVLCQSWTRTVQVTLPLPSPENSPKHVKNTDPLYRLIASYPASEKMSGAVKVTLFQALVHTNPRKASLKMYPLFYSAQTKLLYA